MRGSMGVGHDRGFFVVELPEFWSLLRSRRSWACGTSSAMDVTVVQVTDYKCLAVSPRALRLIPIRLAASGCWDRRGLARPIRHNWGVKTCSFQESKFWNSSGIVLCSGRPRQRPHPVRPQAMVRCACWVIPSLMHKVWRPSRRPSAPYTCSGRGYFLKNIFSRESRSH